MHIVGLTGGISSGKSTVAQMFRDLGAAVIDADEVYHTLIAPVDGQASTLAQKVAAAFPGVIADDGSLDRGALAKQVFGSSAHHIEARKRLDGITHPAVGQEFARRLTELEDAGTRRVIYDVPLLFENRLEGGMEGVVVVWVPADVQLQRLMARDGIDAAAAQKRLGSQMPLDAKRAKATWVIDNSGSREQTLTQVQDLWSAWNAPESP